MSYLHKHQATPTPQSEPIEGREGDQVKNRAGGYVFPVDDWTRLDRFLILGNEGGSYYANQRQLVKSSSQAVRRCIDEDGLRVVMRANQISDEGRAPRNSEALYVLAMCLTHGSPVVKKEVRLVLPLVARTGSHLLEFVSYAAGMRGWGRALRNVVAEWYSQPLSAIEFQCIKYRQRGGWSHRDLLRLSHPKAKKDTAHEKLFHWLTRGVLYDDDKILALTHSFEAMQAAKSGAEALTILNNSRLSWEMIPSELRDDTVWHHLISRLPMNALIRQLPQLTKRGLLKHLSANEAAVIERLTDANLLKKARVHPVNALVALSTYGSGHSVKGKGTWNPNQNIVGALGKAFERSFKSVEPITKRVYLAVDVSGSMGQEIKDTSLTCREVAAAIAMVIARKAKRHVIKAFAESDRPLNFTGRSAHDWGSHTRMSPLAIHADMSIMGAVHCTQKIPFGGTDCALPMLDAMDEKLDVDCFVILTDSESWAGKIHASEALRQYRKKSGINAKFICVAIVANEYSVADPEDSGMMDCVGFDTNLPKIVFDFISE